MAARNISLFFAAKPAFRQRFLSVAISAYSESGMVKLSRTSLVFFGLPGLSFLLFLAAFGTGAGGAFAEFVSLRTRGIGDLVAVLGLA